MTLRLPIRMRIALFGAGVVLLAVVFFGALVALLFERSVYDAQDQVLARRAAQLTQPVGVFGQGRGPGQVRRTEPFRAQLPVDLRTSPDTFVALFDASGQSLASTGQVDGRAPLIPPSLLNDVPAGGQSLATIQDHGVALRVDARHVPAGSVAATISGGTPEYLVVGQSAAAAVAQVNRLRLYVVLAAVLSLLAALVASWVVAGRALQPLDRMTETVEAIGSARDLRRRLPPAPAADEVGRLTTAFNAMMGRLDEAYAQLQGALESQRRFVADASHELRTPLTSIRSNLGLVRRRQEISEADRAEALKDMETEAERMSRLVNDLLTLARADAGQNLDMQAIDLPRVCEEVCRQARRTYPDRRVELGRKPLPALSGNADSLRQLLWILLDNAVRHTRQGGRIKVSLESRAGAARISVSDDGTGITAEDRERIFERFYRADSARPSGGAGLGLSIARWIVQQHGGRIMAEDNPSGPGALFTVELPLPPEASGEGAARQVA